jgi:gamma-glutamyltranspeptidase/glutathione hydrolase
MNIFKAVSSPRIHHQLIPEEIYFEDYAINSDVKNKLETIGHSLKRRNMIGWVNAILVTQEEKFYYGMSDPRGYGLAEGY